MLLVSHQLARTYQVLGNPERARALGEDNLGRARALGDDYVAARALERLAGTAVDERRIRDAASMLKEAYRLNRSLGDLYRIAITVVRFARVLAFADRPETATRLLSSSEAMLDDIGAAPSWVGTMKEETLGSIRAQLDEAAFDKAWERGRNLTADQAVELALNALD